MLSISEDCVVLYDRVIQELGFGLSWPGVTKENCDIPWNSWSGWYWNQEFPEYSYSLTTAPIYLANCVL